MNDRSSEPVASKQSDAGELTGSTEEAASEHPQTTGRELMIVNRDESAVGWFTRFMIRLGFKSNGSLRDDLSEALSGVGLAGNIFTPEERAMLQNIMHLREKRVVDIMVPRAEVEAVDECMPLGELLQRFEETGHSRLPVYDETLDDPRGMVLIKDLLLHITTLSSKKGGKTQKGPKKLDLSKVDLDTPLSKLKVMRRVLFVPPSMLAADLMARMQALRIQMALVIDEYGGTDGLVSLEDIVEEVVGEIEDEHDDNDDLIEVSGEGLWTSDARVELEKLTEVIGTVFDPGEHADDMDTLGGLVFALAGHIPVRGEVVPGMVGFEFRILDADPRRIKRIQIVQTSLRDRRRKAAKPISAAE